MSDLKVCLVLLLVFIARVIASQLFVTAHKYSGPVPCVNNDDCVGLVNSKCDNGFCRCNSSIICQDVSGVTVRKVGESCVHDNNCDIDEAICSDGKCVCKSGYVKSERGLRCLKVLEKIGDICEESAQCFTNIRFSGCQENKCVCQQHTHEYNGICYRDVELDQDCESNAECGFIKFSECIKSKCKCIHNYVPSTKGSRCLQLAEGLWSLCVDDAQCTAILGKGSECENGVCDCQEMYQFKNKTKKCVADRLLGETCAKHSDCHDPFRGSSRLDCVLGECKCKPWFREIEGYCISSSQQIKYSLIIVVWYIGLLQILS